MAVSQRGERTWSPTADDLGTPCGLSEVQALLPAVCEAARAVGLFASLLNPLAPWRIRFNRPGDADVLVGFDPERKQARVGQSVVGGAGAGRDGRDHWPHVFTTVLAGGVRGGLAHGASDWYAAYPRSIPRCPRTWWPRSTTAWGWTRVPSCAIAWAAR
jgi:hypothetical protein